MALLMALTVGCAALAHRRPYYIQPCSTPRCRALREKPVRRVDSLGALEGRKSGGHLCAIYADPEQHLHAAEPFIRQGLDRREKVVYITDPATRDSVTASMAHRGAPIEACVQTGQLVLLDSQGIGATGGTLDEPGMHETLARAASHATAQGYASLRVLVDVTWALHGQVGAQQLVACEAKLNQFLHDQPCIILCLYDQRMHEPSLLLELLRVHPIGVVEGEACQNIYYVPHADFFGENAADAELGRWQANVLARERAEATFRLKDCAVESALSAILFTDLEGNLTYANPAALRLWGCSDMAGLLSQRPQELWQDAAKFAEILDVVSAREAWAGEVVAKRVDDATAIDCQLFASLVADKAGRPIRMMASFVDVTGRKRIEEEVIFYRQHLERLVAERTSKLAMANEQLRDEVAERRAAEEAHKKSEAWLQSMLSSMADMVFVFDAEGKFVFFNAPTMSDLILSPDQFIGCHPRDVMPAHIHGPFEEAFEASRSGQVTEHEYSVMVAGRRRWFMSKLSPIQVDGQFTGAVAVVRDITERRRAPMPAHAAPPTAAASADPAIATVPADPSDGDVP